MYTLNVQEPDRCVAGFFCGWRNFDYWIEGSGRQFLEYEGFQVECYIVCLQSLPCPSIYGLTVKV